MSAPAIARRAGPVAPGPALRTPRRLLESLLSQPWGQMSPSVYETGRLVSLAPWLVDHDRRVEFLLARQQPDGAFGGPGPYGLVPALSAVEALLAELARPRPRRRARLVTAAHRGLAAVRRGLARASELPDTPAVEVLVPALVGAINRHLASGRRVDRGVTGPRLPLPVGVDGPLSAALRRAIITGATLPEKVLHTLEIAGASPKAAATPVPPGTVGASPAATAAWLAGKPDRDPAALAYLEGATRAHGGPVSSVVPITMFERAWVLDSLHRGRVTVRVPARVVASIADGIGPVGTPGGPGLPCDADTTSTVILTAHRLGAHASLAPLRHYETSTHFVTWFGERTASTTTNAHVLECLGGVEDRSSWRRRAMAKVARWLCAQQSDEGTWADKWHASPLYATAAAAGALRAFGGRTASVAVAAAVRWTLDSQREDGSWGVWGGTAEETAYALTLLVPVLSWDGAPRLPRDAVAEAARRGLRHLRKLARSPQMPDYAPLWHDKDLYTPTAVVEAAIIGALRLAGTHPGLARGSRSRPALST